MQNEKLILPLQRRLATLCLLQQTLKEQHAVLAEAYRDPLQARRTKPLLIPYRQTGPRSRVQVADARKRPGALLRRLKFHHRIFSTTHPEVSSPP